VPPDQIAVRVMFTIRNDGRNKQRILEDILRSGLVIQERAEELINAPDFSDEDTAPQYGFGIINVNDIALPKVFFQSMINRSRERGFSQMTPRAALLLIEQFPLEMLVHRQFTLLHKPVDLQRVHNTERTHKYCLRLAQRDDSPYLGVTRVETGREVFPGSSFLFAAST